MFLWWTPALKQEHGTRFRLQAAKAHLTAAALIVDPTTSMGFLEASAAFVASSLDKLRIAAQQSLRDIEARAQQSGVSVQTELVEAGIGTIVETLGPRPLLSTWAAGDTISSIKA